MVRPFGSALTDASHVFDEPTTGLHPHDVERMDDLLIRLRDQGNTVLVAEHEPETLRIGDHTVDLGPGAGSKGGTVCSQGATADQMTSGTVTSRHLDDRATLKEVVRMPTGSLDIGGARTNNLQNVDVDVPLGVLCVLCVVTGVARSGKCSLIHGSLAGRDALVSIDQDPIRGSGRSSPATYTGLLGPIRKAFAKANGVRPSLFSANSEGARPACNARQPAVPGATSSRAGLMDTPVT